MLFFYIFYFNFLSFILLKDGGPLANSCCAQLIMTGVAVLVVDRLGRRPLLIGGVTGIVRLLNLVIN